MGVKASPTCVMDYGSESDGAVGWLLGEPHAGMRTMFTMMNNARLGVAIEGLGLSVRAYQQAVAYAKERLQGRAVGAEPGTRSPIAEHPDVRRMLLTMKSSIEALRAMCYFDAFHLDRSDRHPDSAERDRSTELVELLTPLCKAWGTDLGVEVSSLAMQVHGGMGYIEETGVAQHYRDARITPIYEGTNGIQAIDLVGRKLGIRQGAAFADLVERIRQTIAELSDCGDAGVAIAARLTDATDAVEEAARWLRRAWAKRRERHADRCDAVPVDVRAPGRWVVAGRGGDRRVASARRVRRRPGRQRGEDRDGPLLRGELAGSGFRDGRGGTHRGNGAVRSSPGRVLIRQMLMRASSPSTSR